MRFSKNVKHTFVFYINRQYFWSDYPVDTFHLVEVKIVYEMFFDMGNAFATEADAIAARDARKLILELAMERAK